MFADPHTAQCHHLKLEQAVLALLGQRQQLTDLLQFAVDLIPALFGRAPGGSVLGEELISQIISRRVIELASSLAKFERRKG